MYTDSDRDVARGPTETVTVSYGVGTDERPSTALVRVIAELAEERPVDLGPLYGRIDLEALDDLLEHPRRAAAWSPRVVIDLEGHRITIDRSDVVVEFAVGGTE